jgi:copper resistance protein B
MDNKVFTHVLFEQLEGRTDGPNNEFRWDGQAWAGTDMNKLWLKIGRIRECWRDERWRS